MATINKAKLSGSFSDRQAIASSIIPQSSAMTVDFNLGRASHIEVRIEITDEGSPVVGTDAHWYAPADQTGSPRNIITIKSPSGRIFVSLTDQVFKGFAGLSASSLRVGVRAIGQDLSETFASVNVITGA